MNDCIVVSVAYRLAPEYTFPDAHNDAFHATQWVKENISKYGGNSGSIILAGDSAGGNLATCVAIKCRDFEIPIKAQILIYPWIDGKLENASIKRNGAGYLLTKESIFWFRKTYTPNEADRCHPDVSPKYQSDLSELAPAFILTAEFDPLLDDGKNYAMQLKEFGNHVKYKEYPTLIHGFMNIPKVSKYALQAYEDIRAFINKQ
jgi:acetyl esterase